MLQNMVFALTLLAFLMVFCEIYFEVHYPKITEVKFNTDKLSQDTSFKILQVSDVHSGNFTGSVEFIKQIKRQKPDIIVITGDLINRDTTDFTNAYRFVEELVKVTPKVFFVSGNHEWENDRTEDFLQGLKKLNVVILNNKNITIDFGNTSINICGVDDFHTERADLGIATKGINEKFYTILLSHSPGIVTEKNLPADLILSGHTHGGQVRFPVIGGIVAPGQGFFPKLEKGVYNLEHGKKLYIDSGLGTSVLPIRLFNRSQVSLVTIEGG
ncbi:metallophosphoesterase [Desulfotomaculum sp. 1211_IL3151]|uniref:metallophosphoesterase n=1 Tax=Desulfotomaculum sp. 1211_IL3151 TaxID=3084055 RepID=UPI002FD96A73